MGLENLIFNQCSFMWYLMKSAEFIGVITFSVFSSYLSLNNSMSLVNINSFSIDLNVAYTSNFSWDLKCLSNKLNLTVCSLQQLILMNKQILPDCYLACSILRADVLNLKILVLRGFLPKTHITIPK